MKMMSDLNMSQRKIYYFVAFSFLRVNLVIKLNYFDFESHRDTLIFFYRKKMTSDFNMSWKTLSDLV